MAQNAEYVEKIHEEERTSTVYYLSSANIIRTNTGDWGRVWVDAVGATSAVPEEGPNGDVTPEKAMAWDPDVIVVQGGSDPSALLDGPTPQGMKAIQADEVHSCPIGGSVGPSLA